MARFDEAAGSLRKFPTVVRIVDPAGDPLAWLASQTAGARLVWQGRDSLSTLAGWGAAARVCREPDESVSSVITRCRQTVGASTGRFFGGLAFDSHRSLKDEWRDFGPGQFWWPRVLYDGQAWEVAVLDATDIDQARRDWAKCQPGLGQPGLDSDAHDLPHWISRDYLPSRECWSDIVHDCRQLIDAEIFEKIVMVRRCDLRFSAAVDSLTLFRKLRQRMHSSYLFYFQPRPDVAFLGATPERLFWRERDEVHSEVVAGTRPRKSRRSVSTTKWDGSSCTAKRTSWSTTSFARAFASDFVAVLTNCRSMPRRVFANCRVPSICIRPLLASYGRESTTGRCWNDSIPPRLWAAIPPKMRWPRSNGSEPFSRGWYGAPIGWIGRDSAEFVVGIRSALVQHDLVRLYSGAGLVPGSTAEGEWSEIDQKIKDYLQLLTAAAETRTQHDDRGTESGLVAENPGDVSAIGCAPFLRGTRVPAQHHSPPFSGNCLAIE